MEGIVHLTEELVRFKSMHSNPDEIRKCAGFIENRLDEHGIIHRRFDQNGTPSVLVLPSESHTPIILMSHIDVVDAPAGQFEPFIKDGNLYGRGSIDDKYAVAVSLVLLETHMKRLRQAGKSQKDLPFGVLITGDEEIGGENGAGHVLDFFTTDFCIALDGGNIKNIVTMEKGVLTLGLIANGKAAHGSRPWLGENAIENLFADYQQIKSLFDVSAPDHWHRTMSFSMVHAGESFNQVPDRAEAVFDIRFTENDDVDALINDIRNRVRGEIEVRARHPMFDGGESPYLDLLLEVAKTGRPGREHGASDARFLTERGVKGVVWGADGDDSAHGADEHVNIESMLILFRILDEFFLKSESV